MAGLEGSEHLDRIVSDSAVQLVLHVDVSARGKRGRSGEAGIPASRRHDAGATLPRARPGGFFPQQRDRLPSAAGSETRLHIYTYVQYSERK